MFDEISTEGAEYQVPQTSQSTFSDEFHELERIVAEVLLIEERHLDDHEQIAARFVGQLMIDSAAAFEQLEAQLAPLDYHVQLSTVGKSQEHQVLVVQGRFAPKPRPVWPNALLLVLTIITTMWAGATIDSDATSISDLLRGGIFDGLPYALSVMLILGAHELGHYFAARHHRVSVTLPYFIPLPLGLFGTLGAFIQLREPMKNRKQLFDVGISGPLAGLVFALPILIIGIATADVNPLPTEQDCLEDDVCGYILEGNSIVYITAKRIIHGDWLPNDVEDMTLNQLAFAGWTGLFVTGLNLIPVGQLDGGHILYTLIGKRARQLYLPAMIAMAFLAFVVNTGWILWLVLLFLFGRFHAVPMDDITPLGTRRRVLGYITLVVFFLIFTPSPFTIVNLS